jgi:hypothetical protein
MRDPRETVLAAIDEASESLVSQGFRRTGPRSHKFVRREKDRLSSVDLTFEYESRHGLGTFWPTVFAGFRSLEKLLQKLPPELVTPPRPAYGLAGDIARLPPAAVSRFQVVEQATSVSDISSWLVPKLEGPVRSFLKECSDPAGLVRTLSDPAHPFYSESRVLEAAVLQLKVCADRPSAIAAAERLLAMAVEFRRGAKRPLDVETGDEDIRKAQTLLDYVSTEPVGC